METRSPSTIKDNFPANSVNTHYNPSDEFVEGITVIYGLHGKCTVTGIVDRQIGPDTIRFYKLEIQKSNLSRSIKQEPAIWLPVNFAKERGLRTAVDNTQTSTILTILTNREFYFQLSEPWSTVYPKLELVIRTEGAAGLAKAFSFLYVLKKRQVVPSSELNRLYETVCRLLFRELSDALQEPARLIEEKVIKGMRHKLQSDC